MSANPIEKAISQMNRKDAPATDQPYEKVTYDKLASLLGVSRQTVINWRDDPSKMPLEKLTLLQEISGVPFQVLMRDDDMKMPTPDLKMYYSKNIEKLKSEISTAERGLNSVQNMEIADGTDKAFYSIKEDAIKELRELVDTTKALTRKARISVIGPSDVGKSSLLNQHLGEKILPASYTPLTSAITGIHGIDDKPSFMGKDDDAIVYFRKIVNGEPDGEAVPFDEFPQEGSDRCVIGDHRSILNAYGTREGAYFESEDICIDAIHIFIDKPLLKEVDYYDVPGFGSGSVSDDVSLTQKTYQSDIVFYLSTTDAFLRGTDLSTLTNMLMFHANDAIGIKSCFVLATHADGAGGKDVVDDIINKGVKRLTDSLTDSQLEQLGVTRDNVSALTARFFPFDISNIGYCRKINEEYEKSIKEWVDKKKNAAEISLRRACSTHADNYTNAINNIDSDIAEQEISYEEINAQKEEATSKIHAIENRLKNSINKHRDNCLTEFRKSYNKIVNEDFIVDKMKEKGVKNKKDSLNDFTSYLCNEINDAVSETSKENSEQFTDEVNESIEEYRNIWSKYSGDNNIKIDMSDFNFQRAFAAGLAGIVSYGALALWASVAAAGSNLGAYILVAKIVSALSALGISVGGTAAATSAVAAIGGPVVLGVAIALVAAIAIWGILTGTWRNRAAKKIIKGFEDQGVYGKCTDQIKKYWNDTEDALNSCLKSLNDETIKAFDIQINMKTAKGKEILKKALIKLYTRLVTIYGDLATS